MLRQLLVTLALTLLHVQVATADGPGLLPLATWHARIEARERAWRAEDPGYEALISAAGLRLSHHYGKPKSDDRVQRRAARPRSGSIGRT